MEGGITMSDKLTRDDINLLSKPFRRVDHEFTRGYVYITEGAITARLDEVDPAWTFEIQQVSVRDKQGVCAGRLTVKGVTRENVGMQAIELGNNDREVGEAEKGAVTDALKRCARLFGIGRYLLDDPPKVNGKDDADFNKWLVGKQKAWMELNAPKGETVPVEPPAPPPAPTLVPKSEPPTMNLDAAGLESANEGKPVPDTIKPVMRSKAEKDGYYHVMGNKPLKEALNVKNQVDFDNAVAALKLDGKPTETLDDILAGLYARAGMQYQKAS